MSTAIEFENISKQYRLGLVSTGTLSHDLNRFWQTKVLRREDPYLKVGEVNDRAHKGASEYVWALKDINFKVEQGDVVGIIGRNGAGKSTLLKLLSRVTAPTTGIIRAKGRIASLLEVGTGFHPEMTGRENIYMNGAIMGMSRAEITRKLDEIVDFSGCERYLDTPVKRYSSGMTVRLGFAIAAHLEPEILVVDEVLAVGDAEFQKKAIGKMQDVSKGEGRTVLFVSHNMGAVKNLCKRGIVLNQGQVAFDGGVEEAVEFYTSTHSKSNIFEKIICDTNHLNPAKDAQFLSVKFEKNSNDFATSENINFIFNVYAHKAIEKCRINLTIFSTDGTPIGSVSNTESFFIEKNEKKTIRLSLQESGLAMGAYDVSFSIGTGNYQTCQTDFDIISKILSFQITRPSLANNISVSQWNNGWGKIMFNSKTEVLE